MQYLIYIYFQKVVLMIRHEHIKIDLLYEMMQSRKLTKTDKFYIYNHLSTENKEKLMDMNQDKPIKRLPKSKSKVKLLPKIILTVVDNSMMAAEMATSIAKAYPHTSVAILDADRLNPTLSTYLNTKKYVKSIYTHLTLSRSTGINLLIDGLQKKQINKTYLEHLAIKSEGYRNFSFFSGSELLEDYEYFKLDDFIQVVQLLEQEYDVLFLSINKFIYDAYSCYAMLKSHVNLIGVEGQTTHIKEMKRYVDFLEVKQDIKKEKNLFVLFNYDKNVHLSEDLVDTYVAGYYLGNIPYNKRRGRDQRQYPFTKFNNSTYKYNYVKLFKSIIERLEL